MSTLRSRLTSVLGARAAAKFLRAFEGQVLRVPRLRRARDDRRVRDLAAVSLLETRSQRNPDQTVSYQQVADAFGMSRRHLVRLAKRNGPF